MIGWIVLAALMAGAFVLLRRLGVPRDLASFVGAALMLGAAGYALQGRPALPGASARPPAQAAELDASLGVLRGDMFGRFMSADTYFALGDAMTRTGNPRAAVAVYLGAVNAEPDNAALWTSLGAAYAEHDGNRVSPAARFAFDQAMRLAPDHSGPPFFLGIAYVRAGEFRTADRWWRRAYALTPPRVSYRGQIGERLMLLEAFLQSPAGRSAR